MAVRLAAIINSPAPVGDRLPQYVRWDEQQKKWNIRIRSTRRDVVNFNNQWFDTLTGRLGYAVAPTWLLYFQGGAAWGHTSTNIDLWWCSNWPASNTRTGWTIGGGVEWMFAPHWSAFLEGNYMDFGGPSRDRGHPTLAGCAAGCPWSAKATEATVLVGVNYRFW